MISTSIIYWVYNDINKLQKIKKINQIQGIKLFGLL